MDQSANQPANQPDVPHRTHSASKRPGSDEAGPPPKRCDSEEKTVPGSPPSEVLWDSDGVLAFKEGRPIAILVAPHCQDLYLSIGNYRLGLNSFCISQRSEFLNTAIQALHTEKGGPPYTILIPSDADDSSRIRWIADHCQLTTTQRTWSGQGAAAAALSYLRAARFFLASDLSACLQQAQAVFESADASSAQLGEYCALAEAKNLEALASRFMQSGLGPRGRKRHRHEGAPEALLAMCDTLVDRDTALTVGPSIDYLINVAPHRPLNAALLGRITRCNRLIATGAVYPRYSEPPDGYHQFYSRFLDSLGIVFPKKK